MKTVGNAKSVAILYNNIKISLISKLKDRPTTDGYYVREKAKSRKRDTVSNLQLVGEALVPLATWTQAIMVCEKVFTW